MAAEVRVVVVEDHVLFAESLALAFRLGGHDVRRPSVASDTTAPDLVAAVLTHQPDVVILDLDLGARVDGADLIGPLASAGINVVVVTGTRDQAEWGLCLHQGAQAVVAKHAPLADILVTVSRLDAGRPAMSRRVRDELVASWRNQGQRAASVRERFARLTPREREVLDELADGRRIHDIAVADVVSEATVRTQVKSILSKLEVRSQVAAVLLVHRNDHPRANGRGERRL